MHVINLPEPITGVILGVQFVNGVGRTNVPTTARFFAKYRGAVLSTPAEMNAKVAGAIHAYLASREVSDG